MATNTEIKAAIIEQAAADSVASNLDAAKCVIESVRAVSNQPDTIVVVVREDQKDSFGEIISSRHARARVKRTKFALPDNATVLSLDTDMQHEEGLMRAVAAELEMEPSELRYAGWVSGAKTKFKVDLAPDHLNYFGSFVVAIA